MRFMTKVLALFQVALVVIKLFGLVDLTWVQVFYPVLVVLAPIALSIVCIALICLLSVVSVASFLISVLILLALFDFDINIGD